MSLLVKKKIIYFIILPIVIIFIVSCNSEERVGLVPTDPNPINEIFYLPVVVHVLHKGESIGEGANLSEKRIQRQIEILNEDFRRKEGTRGYNNDPNGGDSKIEFRLAKRDMHGKITNGINRIDMTLVNVLELGYNQNHFAQYDYWNPNNYINVWTTPLPAEADCLVLGSSTGPYTDLPGSHLLNIPGINDTEGILINTVHFGESSIDCHARFGRTLTHEMGHYLGLLHLWGSKDCKLNDYCEDTPAVDGPDYWPYNLKGCKGEVAMIGNYMNFSQDIDMNIFTNDQISRMHYVLKNHEGRKTLVSSDLFNH